MARCWWVRPRPYFSENFVEYWLYFIGGLFMFVVMFLPDGLAGLVERLRARLRQPG